MFSPLPLPLLLLPLPLFLPSFLPGAGAGAVAVASAEPCGEVLLSPDPSVAAGVDAFGAAVGVGAWTGVGAVVVGDEARPSSRVPSPEPWQAVRERTAAVAAAAAAMRMRCVRMVWNPRG